MADKFYIKESLHKNVYDEDNNLIYENPYINLANCKMIKQEECNEMNNVVKFKIIFCFLNNFIEEQVYTNKNDMVEDYENLLQCYDSCQEEDEGSGEGGGNGGGEEESHY